MGKWDKVVDQIDEEEGLTRAPEFQDTVVDVVDPADTSMPAELRGCQVIERQHPGGQSEVFYCRPDGVTYMEAQATALIDSFRAGGQPQVPGGPPVNVPGAVPAPPPEVEIDRLGTGNDANVGHWPSLPPCADQRGVRASAVAPVRDPRVSPRHRQPAV